VTRDLTEQELADWQRIERANDPPGYRSPLDDPEWIRRDNERWLARKQRSEEFTRTGRDPSETVKAVARATGGEALTPATAEQEPNEEEG
jgi:hypothetical protein